MTINCLKEGHQQNHEGAIDMESCQDYIHDLNGHHPEGVLFKFDPKITRLQGGVCTAKVVSYLQNEGDIAGVDDVDRAMQAAFNSITLTEPVADVERAKIQAIINFADLKISNCTDAFNVIETVRLPEIEEGAYFVRLWLPEANHKGEAHGHSMLLTKTATTFQLYDPNQGELEIKASQRVMEYFFSIHEIFNTPQCRLYAIRH